MRFDFVLNSFLSFVLDTPPVFSMKPALPYKKVFPSPSFFSHTQEVNNCKNAEYLGVPSLKLTLILSKTPPMKTIMEGIKNVSNWFNKRINA